jgi:hypothetical protein
MRITKKNVGRLASISALGAGALSVGAGTAEAGTIQYTPLSGKVGFSSGYGTSFKTSVVPGVIASIRRSTTGVNLGPGGLNYFGFVGLRGRVTYGISYTGGFIRFKVQNAALGQKWSDLSPLVGTNLLLGRRSSYGSTFGAKGNFYKLFEFQTSASGTTEFGWIDFNQSVSPTSGPDVDILGIAFDTSGAQIAAGDMGSTNATPEPSTAGLASLAALALGAKGLRRWRAARKQAA